MAVTDRNTIDFINEEDNYIILYISDNLSWEDDMVKAHWLILMDKVKDYMGYIQSGQLKELYPENTKIPCVEILFFYPWPEVVEKYLMRLKTIWEDCGFDLGWNLFEPEDTEEM